MSIFGNKDIIPDDVAEKIAQNLFVLYSRRLEYNIDEDIKTYLPYEDLKMRPFWHYSCGDNHYTLKIERRITQDMEFRDLFVKGNGYMSLDRFNCIHTVNKKSLLKVLELVTSKFAAQDKSFVYRIFYDKYYKSKCFVPYAYITLEQKLMRGEGRGHTTMCRFPKPDHVNFRLNEAPFEITSDSPDIKTDIRPSGITLLSEQELLAYKKYIGFQQKDRAWWLREKVPGMPRCAKVIQPNEMICPRNVEHRNGISPAVKGDFKRFKRGTKLLYAGHKWTVVSEDKMLIDDLLGSGPYYYYSQEGGYEESDIKAFIDRWFSEHKDDPVNRFELQ
ncbi:MAG: hypothetical protein IJ757_05860 [Clostridiales bacterium]|nr:hypothetical protein [Clostridiales bacterium]